MAKDMQVKDLKDRLKALILQRESLEHEAAEISARLDSKGVGLSGGLIDKEVGPASSCDAIAAADVFHASGIPEGRH